LQKVLAATQARRCAFRSRRRLLGLPIRFRDRRLARRRRFRRHARRVSVVVDSSSLEMMRGSELDFVDDLMARRSRSEPQRGGLLRLRTSFTI